MWWLTEHLSWFFRTSSFAFVSSASYIIALNLKPFSVMYLNWSSPIFRDLQWLEELGFLGHIFVDDFSRKVIRLVPITHLGVDCMTRMFASKFRGCHAVSPTLRWCSVWNWVKPSVQQSALGNAPFYCYSRNPHRILKGDMLPLNWPSCMCLLQVICMDNFFTSQKLNIQVSCGVLIKACVPLLRVLSSRRQRLFLKYSLNVKLSVDALVIVSNVPR